MVIFAERAIIFTNPELNSEFVKMARIQNCADKDTVISLSTTFTSLLHNGYHLKN